MISKFSDIAVAEPDLDQLSKRYSEFRELLSRPGTDPLPAIRDWDQLRRELITWQNLVELRFNQDTSNEQFSTEQKRCDEISPQLTELDISIKKLILEGPHRESLEQRFGQQAFALWKSEALAFDAKIKEDLVTESKLTVEYNSLLSSAELEFQGQKYNHEGIDQFKFSADRSLRQQALQTKWSWFESNVESLNSNFEQIVQTRHRMAETLGYSNYVELGYLRRCRVDYDQSDVEKYRQQVIESVVPFCQELIEQKRAALGVEKIMFWDESVHTTTSHPTPQGDHDWMIARAKEMFSEMSPELDKFFRLLVEHELLDLKNRDHKGGGGFCTDFPKYGLPYIFANFNGTSDDVRVFTHEVGHAFQGFSSREQEIYDYVWPTYESCEIHSMGLEFMTFPFMDKFFGEQGAQFCREHVIDSFLFLPYGVAVDHFQHLVYEHPEAGPADRMHMWKEVELIYLPWRDYGDLPHLPNGGRWQLQRHIYMYPFYYIDYTLALACALQLWQKSSQDFQATLTDYQALCSLGGQFPFQQLTASAKLRSPFESGVLSDCVLFAKKYLAANS